MVADELVHRVDRTFSVSWLVRFPAGGFDSISFLFKQWFVDAGDFARQLMNKMALTAAHHNTETILVATVQHSNSKNWFTTSNLRRCRKAVLGVCLVIDDRLSELFFFFSLSLLPGVDAPHVYVRA